MSGCVMSWMCTLQMFARQHILRQSVVCLTKSLLQQRGELGGVHSALAASRSHGTDKF